MLTLWFDYGHLPDVHEALIEGIRTIDIDTCEMEGGERNHEREEGGMVSGTHLGVLFAHVGEQVMDELVDEFLWGVDASDDLRDHLEPGSDLPTDGRLQEPKSNEEGGG